MSTFAIFLSDLMRRIELGSSGFEADVLTNEPVIRVTYRL